MTANHNDHNRETDLFKVQLSIYIDLYKHHFDLFLKASVIYLAVVSGLAVASLRVEDFVARCGLSIMASAATIVGFLAGKIYIEWLTGTEESLRNISDKLGIPPVVFTQTKKMITIEQGVSVLLFFAGLVNIIRLIKEKMP